MKKVLVTGGCGFIGSNFIRYLLSNKKETFGIEKIINLDKQTYAGKGRNIEHMGLSDNIRYFNVLADICSESSVNEIFKEYKPDYVFNFAAESHVDRSIQSSKPFLETNVGGTFNLLEAARQFPVKRFIQISTDEVYGSKESGDSTSFNEEDRLNASSSYSASKAAAEHFANAYFKTYGVPVLITRSANNYGPYQFPEKILPLFITNLIEGKKVPLMWSEENPGLNIRDWLHVYDNCRAIWYVALNGRKGEIYNIPGENERTNIDMTKKVLDYFAMGEDMIERVAHRKGHDFRYSITGDKLRKLGFKYTHKNLDSEIRSLCEWYKNNEEWWEPLKKQM